MNSLEDFKSWEWVKIAQRQICTRGLNCTRKQNCTKTILHQGSTLHKLLFCTEGNFCMRVKKKTEKQLNKIKNKKINKI